MDFKWKEIPLWFSVLGGMIGIVICIVEERIILDVFFSCLPGVLSICFSWLTKETIGYGDGIVLLVMGIYLPLSQLISVGMLAFFIAGIVALLLLTVFRKKGNYRIPFIPFLGIAYGLECMIRIGEKTI
ncbi:MAG: prepilin peptidase [Agathobacter sp.]|nr:prepilin peptidase [Agathobacter sp.]